MEGSCIAGRPDGIAVADALPRLAAGRHSGQLRRAAQDRLLLVRACEGTGAGEPNGRGAIECCCETASVRDNVPVVAPRQESLIALRYGIDQKIETLRYRAASSA